VHADEAGTRATAARRPRGSVDSSPTCGQPVAACNAVPRVTGDHGPRQAAGWGSPAEERRQEACSRA
jgi:hypothetical protein